MDQYRQNVALPEGPPYWSQVKELRGNRPSRTWLPSENKPLSMEEFMAKFPDEENRGLGWAPGYRDAMAINRRGGAAEKAMFAKLQDRAMQDDTSILEKMLTAGGSMESNAGRTAAMLAVGMGRNDVGRSQVAEDTRSGLAREALAGRGLTETHMRGTQEIRNRLQAQMGALDAQNYATDQRTALGREQITSREGMAGNQLAVDEARYKSAADLANRQYEGNETDREFQRKLGVAAYGQKVSQQHKDFLLDLLGHRRAEKELTGDQGINTRMVDLNYLKEGFPIKGQDAPYEMPEATIENLPIRRNMGEMEKAIADPGLFGRGKNELYHDRGMGFEESKVTGSPYDLSVGGKTHPKYNEPLMQAQMRLKKLNVAVENLRRQQNGIITPQQNDLIRRLAAKEIAGNKQMENAAGGSNVWKVPKTLNDILQNATSR